MNISLNIILDTISRYRFELHVKLPTAAAFRRVSILSRDQSPVHENCLYVCRLSDALRISTQDPGFYFICLRDRIHDERETAERLSGMIIINENLELDQLFTEIQDTFFTINDWYQQMQDAIIRQKSMQDIIAMSESVIGNFITVSDAAFSLLAYTKGLTTDDPMQLALIKNGYHAEESVKLFKKQKRFDVWMNTPDLIINTDRNLTTYDIISKVFVFNETYFTHVVMICNHRKISAGLMDLFSHFIHILSFYVNRNWDEVKNYDHFYSAFISDLIEGKITDTETVQDRAKSIGIRPNDQYVVMLLSGNNGSDPVFPGLLAVDITKMFPRIKPIHYNNRLILFLHHQDVKALMNEQELEQKLNSYLEDHTASCGISEVFDSLLDLPCAYAEAAVALGDAVSGARWPAFDGTSVRGNIEHFDNCFASCLLNRDKHTVYIWERSRFGQLLLELYRQDREKNTNNLEVLYTYMTNERRSGETAALLHMHRNNVIYRVSRIVDQLGLDLDDLRTRQNLFISFQMLKLSKLFDGVRDSDTSSPSCNE